MAFAVRNIARAAGRAALRPALHQLAKPALASKLPSLTSRAFTQSAVRLGSGEVDKELSSKLSSELKIEQENDFQSAPEHVQEYIEKGPFQITDKAGTDEVTMTRQFGNESIKIVFSVSEINNTEDSMNEFLEDEEVEGALEADSTSGGRSAEANEALEEEDSFPIRCNITISKNNAGALMIDAVAQDGAFLIDNCQYYKSEKLALDGTVESDWDRRGLYMGPPFSNLDEELQVIMERYLEERGIDAELALFIPDFIEYKEQKEYVGWLEGVKKFIDQ
ncbi:Mitochondrial acidic protein mam33 [Saitoella coloradoensis]